MEFCFLAAVASGLLGWGHFISSDIVDLIAQILFKAHGSHCAWLSSCFSVFVSFSSFFVCQTRSVHQEELLNSRQNTPQNLQPLFDYSDVLLNIVVGGAAALFR